MGEKLSVDVVIVGSGFGGSLTALLLDRVGFKVVLVDRGRHPRFAIGESSTPIADLVLRDLAQRYDLPQLLPLTRYGSWKQNYPNVTCGLKRGFSYFAQQPDEYFQPTANHQNELLVAASSNDSNADTHWLRSDVDSFLVSEVQAAGIPHYDQTELQVLNHSPRWQFQGVRENSKLTIDASFLVDASGTAAFLPLAMNLECQIAHLRTNSSAVFAHFADVVPWHTHLSSRRAYFENHPFDCDAAALHHIIKEGWMWQLRFDNQITSAGFVINGDQARFSPAISVEEIWHTLVKRYPSIDEQFASAHVVAPDGGMTRTGRLQRRWASVAGPNWALLPHTAGFIDPLYSTGIAHTMCGIEYLVQLLQAHWKKESLREQLHRYAQKIQAELDLIDELVHGSYRAMKNFEIFVPYSMLYFAASTTYEQRRSNIGTSALQRKTLGHKAEHNK